MHKEVTTYLEKIKKLFPNHFVNAEVLDCGSYNVNGHNRDFLYDCNYIGIDIFDGKNVDVVCAVKDYNPGNKFKTILSTEMLEHDSTRKESLLKMYDLLEEGGLLAVTCANVARREHGTSERGPSDSPATNDYYRNLDSQDILGILPNAIIEESEDRTDIRFYVVKE